MFNPFKKSPVSSPQSTEKAVAEDLEKDIVVHVMPKHFRTAHTEAKQAKTTGALILILGLVFLFAVGLLFYYFIFVYQPKKIEPAAIEKNMPAQEEAVGQEATSTSQIASSIDSIASSSEMVATTTATSTEIIASSSEAVELLPATDVDQDGLTDDEENILGTDKNKNDSDGDTYSDLSEFSKLYNPAGAGKLENNPKMSRYSNNYSFIYPNAWQVQKLPDDSIKIGFKSADDSDNDSVKKQFVEINVSPNYKKQLVGDWYKEQFNLAFIDPTRIIEHKNEKNIVDWQGIKNEDGLTIYLTDKNYENIYTINYNLGLGSTLNYVNIFNLIIGSFNIDK